jgi:hypothetical protein
MERNLFILAVDSSAVTGQQFDSFGGFRVFKKKVGQVSGARN